MAELSATEYKEILEILTTGDSKGTGYFDSAMRVMKSHLLEEFTAGRISNNEYATSYIEAAASTFSGSIQYALQAPKAKYEAELAMINAETAAITLSIREVELDIAKQKLIEASKANELLEEQILKMRADTALTTQQKENAEVTKEILLHDVDAAKFKAEATEYRAFAEYAATHSTLPDGSPIGGTIGKDNENKDAQTQSFKMKDKFQMINALMSSNNAQVSTTGETVLAPDATIGQNIDSMISSYNLSADLPEVAEVTTEEDT